MLDQLRFGFTGTGAVGLKSICPDWNRFLAAGVHSVMQARESVRRYQAFSALISTQLEFFGCKAALATNVGIHRIQQYCCRYDA